MTKRMKAVVVGAGVGGLSCAARLAHDGFEVTVYEKGQGPGGRCGRIEVGGHAFDLGPTLLLMPEVLEATFTALGRKMTDYLTLQRVDPNYTIHFHDQTTLTCTSELTRMQAELERLEPGSFRRYLEFLAQGRNQYQVSLERFVSRNYDGALPFFSPRNLRKVFEVKAHRKMYAEVSRFFKDARLRAALTFQTMYLGISPFDAPAVYGLLPFTELAVGIWFPEGGLHAVPKALEKVCREEGVTFHYGQEVRRILCEGGVSTGLELADGERVDADLVVCNADLPWAYKHLLDAKDTTLPRAEKLRYTSSAYMMYLGLKRQVSGLGHHTVVLGRDYEQSFRDIFDGHRVPEDPSFYLNIPARTDPSLSPEGKDGLYVLVPVPHRHESLDWSVEGPKVRQKVFKKLRELGFGDLEADIEHERTVTPDDWATELNLDMGAAFGLSHDFWQVGPFRPKNQDPNIRNLFFVGASTQPGTGLPMVLLSAQLTHERVRDHAGLPAVPTAQPTAGVDAAAGPSEVAA